MLLFFFLWGDATYFVCGIRQVSSNGDVRITTVRETSIENVQRNETRPGWAVVKKPKVLMPGGGAKTGKITPSVALKVNQTLLSRSGLLTLDRIKEVSDE